MQLELDRLTPRSRPARPSSGHQKWRDLLFVHWRYPIDAVRALVPRELELDTWDGSAWLGVVPFEMQDIRPSWLPRFAALDFLETNLRTYVHHRGEPGVFFFSLEASSRLAVHAARIGWSLPYHLAAMKRTIEEDAIRYRSVRASDPRAALDVTYRVGGGLESSEPGSFEFFLLERYYLFSMRRGRVYQGHVHHVPYPAHRAEVLAIDDGLVEAAGFARASATPDAVHFSPGVDVEVFGPWAL